MAWKDAEAQKKHLEKLHALVRLNNPAKRTDVRKKISESMRGKYIGRKNPMFGKHHTEKVKKILSEKARRNFGENNPFWKGGKHRKRSTLLAFFKKKKCYFCPFSIERVLQIHHLKYRADGGRDLKENLILVCPNHHRMIHCGIDPSSWTWGEDMPLPQAI